MSVWKSDETLLSIYILNFSFRNDFVWEEISNIRHSVSSPDETPRRELKIRRAAEYFWRTSRCFIYWWNTVSNVWYFFSNKIIFEGEIKDAKMNSFSSDIQTLIKHQFPLNFLYELLMSLSYQKCFQAVIIASAYIL